MHLLGSCAAGGDGKHHDHRRPRDWKVEAVFLRELLVFLDLEVFRTQSSALNRFFSCSKQGPDPHDLEYFSSVFKAFMVEWFQDHIPEGHKSYFEGVLVASCSYVFGGRIN